MSNWLSFLIRSVLLGIIVSGLLLVFVPELRKGDGSIMSLFSVEQAPPEKMSYYRAVNRAAPAVVNIYSNSIDIRSSIFRRQQVERTSLGSGVIMSQNGYILTCLHVIQNAESILVGLPDGQVAAAELVGQDSFTDLAVLKIPGGNLHVIPQLDDPNTRVGDVVLAIGNPLNLGQTVTQGIVSRTGRNVSANFIDFIQTDAVLNEGNSGGALIDSNGNLIGINNANFKTLDSRRRVIDVNGVFFAVPYSLAKRVMDEIIANGRATHGVLGFSGAEWPNIQGIVVNRVFDNGPADKAGIQPQDIILSVNGRPVQGVNKTLDMVANTSPGTELQLEIKRGTQVITLPVTVAEMGATN